VLQNLMPRIMGFIVIILTLALGPSIYTANATILAWGVLDPFIGLEVVAGFGAFIIILGLLISGGLFTVAGIRGRLASAGMNDILLVVGAVIVVIVMLTMFTNILDWCDDLITAAIAEGDTLGEIGFGIIPIVIYVGIIAAAGWAQVHTYRRMRKGGKSKALKSQAAYY
jgi:heme/copper-type cytochrome/quinol oxidase subunit 2